LIDLSGWLRKDPDGTYTVQDSRVSWLKADRTTVRYIGKETSIVSDFQHSFIVCINECHIEDELNRGLLRLWELRIDKNNLLWTNARKASEGWTAHFQQRYKGQGLWVYDSTEILTLGQKYLVEITRTGDQHRLRVLNEKTDTVYVDTGENRGLIQSFCWIRVASTIISRRNNGNWSTGYVEKLKIS
jgi:hypothetical protein